MFFFHGYSYCFTNESSGFNQQYPVTPPPHLHPVRTWHRLAFRWQPGPRLTPLDAHSFKRQSSCGTLRELGQVRVIMTLNKQNHVNTLTRAHMHMQTYTFTDSCTHLYIWLFIYIYVSVSTNIYGYGYLWIHVCKYLVALSHLLAYIVRSTWKSVH